jgi:hypothetical protein
MAEDRTARSVKAYARGARLALWLQVLVAAAALGASVWLGGRIAEQASELANKESQLAKAESRRAEVEEKISLASASLLEVEAKLKASEEKLAASLGALGRVPERQRLAAVDEQIAANPSAVLLPRVYLHIVDESDRAWAVAMGRRLESAGMIAVKVEYVPRARGLKRSDVRYYRKSEEPGAARIVSVLKSAGTEARLNYLEDQETNSKVRPNHFEVWFVAGASKAASAGSEGSPAPTESE